MPHGISSYRVAGFSLPWAVIGCCGPLLLMVRRRPALRGLLISSLALLGLARYGLIAYIAADPDRRNAAAESRVGDYRVLADRLENRITEHLGRPEEVVVYNGSSTGRGVEYLLLYSAWIHRKPPWTLRIWGDDPDDVGAEEAGATGPVTRVLIIDENLARDPATGQLPEALVRHLRYARDHSRVPPARVMGVLILPMAPRPGQSATGSDGTSLRGRRPLGPAAGKAVPVAVRTARP
jgi:hypothetical protein